MGKALKAVGTAIVIVGAIAATGGAALAFGAGAGLLGSASLATSAVLSVGSFSVSAGALLTVGSLVSSVGGALSQPKVSTAGSALGWVGDPNGPMHFAVGRIAVAGDLRHKKAYGPNDRMYFSAVTVVSDAGPITEFESFTANDIPVTFGANGKAETSYFANVMWMRRQLGNQPEASYLASPPGLQGGVSLPDWGPSHKLSGKAAFVVTLSENSKGSAYKGQQPKPRHIIKGLRVYDWRQDSTYPGGAGSQRLNDPSTWTFSENPALWAAKWTYGLWEGPIGKGAPQIDYQVGGIGVTPGVIDFASLTELANIADTHGWKVAAWPSTDDDKAQVLNAFLQAAGAYYIEKSGKMSCLHRAAPRVSVATVTAADTAGPIELDTSSSYVDRKNTGVPTYLSEADGWKMTALGEVSAPEWVTQDGGRQRSMPMTYSFVPQAKQAAELMCLGIANTREGISGRIPLKPYMQGIEAGSAFTITEPEFVLNGLKCLALETSYDATTGVHTVTFVSETDGKYAYAYGQSPTPPAPPALEAIDPTFVTQPFPEDWVVTPRPPSEDGTQQPGFDLTGLVSNATATAVIVEWGAPPTEPLPDPLPVGTTLADYIAWDVAYQGPPDVQRIPITGLQSGQSYYIAVRYQRDQNYSKRYVYGPYEAPTLKAGISDETIQDIVRDVVDQVDGIATGRDEAEKVAEVVLETILNEQDSLEREAEERLNADTGVLNEARSHTDGKVAEAMNLVYTKAETDAGVASTLQAAKSYTDGKQSEAQLLFSTKTERANGDATAVIQAKAYTDDYKTQASLTFATQVAMGQANAETLSTAQSYSDGKLATALNTVYTKAQTDSAISTTLQQARSYSDDKAAEATLLYSTKTERANGDASTLHSAKSYTDDYKSTAALTFATQSSLNDVTATAALALSTSQDAASKLNEARIRIVADAQGGQPALVEIVSSTSAGSYIRLGAQQIGFGDNTVFNDATDTLQTVINGRRRVLALGAPFGQAGDLIEWWGPSNISLGSMTTGNGDNGRMTASPYVFDNTLASAFSASANTGFIGGARSGAGNVQTSNSVTVTVSGGTAGATIRWVRLTGDSRINMNDPTGFTTGAYATIGVGEVISAYFMGAVTKSGKSAVVYVQVDLSDNGT